MDHSLFSSRLRLRHIHCFVAVAQERNVGKAADRLSLSQPAVSKTLSELEEIVGARLFERGRLGAQLTPDGNAFLAHAVNILEALHAAAGAVGSAQEQETESIHVGALPSVAPDLIPAALHAFRRTRPQARVLIQTAANAPLLEMLKTGEVDFVLGRMADPQMMAGLTFELLYMEPLLLVVRAGHPLAATGTVSLNDVTRFPLVVSPQGTVPRHNTESHFHAHGLRLPANCTETLSVSVARQIVLHSECVWFAPAGAAREGLVSRDLVALPVPTAGTEEPVGLLRRSEGAASPLAADFMKILREFAAGRHPSRKRHATAPD